MKLTQSIMKKTYEEVIDKRIKKIKEIQDKGLSDDKDILLLDTCLKYVILLSEIREGKE